MSQNSYFLHLLVLGQPGLIEMRWISSVIINLTVLMASRHEAFSVIDGKVVLRQSYFLYDGSEHRW